MLRFCFVDFVFFQLFIQEDNEIECGNFDFDFIILINFDLFYECYFMMVGVFIVGVFYKDIFDNVFFVMSEEICGGDVFEVMQLVNGVGGEIIGFEFFFQNCFCFLLVLFDGFGIYVNVMVIDLEVQYFDCFDMCFLGQVDEVFNFVVFYEKVGFLGRIIYNYISDWIFEVGGSFEEDQIVDDYGQFDLLLCQSFIDCFLLIFDVINVNDEEY